MIMKIKISAILPIAIILSMLKVFSVSATSEISENNFTYSVINDSNCVVTKYDGEASDISIPEMVNGKTVSGIASKAFSLNQSIISVSMPDSIEFIGDRAFTDCKNLSSISFSDKITEIEHNAFNGCISLKAVSLPKELQQIGSSAFRNCTKLADIRFNSKYNSVGYDAFTNTKWYDDQKDGYIYFTNVLYGYKGNMPENEVLEIPDSITCIAECALRNQLSLNKVIFSANLASIGWGAFQNTGIEELNLPLVSAIEDSTFYNCSKLRSVIIPDSVETIGYAAFENCPLLSDVKIQNGSLDFIDMSAFLDCNSLKKIYIPKNVSNIGQWALGYVSERLGNSDEVEVKPIDFTISGYSSTAAEEYAKKNGFEFVAVDGEKSIDEEPLNEGIDLDVDIESFESAYTYAKTLFNKEYIKFDELKDWILSEKCQAYYRSGPYSEKVRKSLYWAETRDQWEDNAKLYESEPVFENFNALFSTYQICDIVALNQSYQIDLYDNPVAIVSFHVLSEQYGYEESATPPIMGFRAKQVIIDYTGTETYETAIENDYVEALCNGWHLIMNGYDEYITSTSEATQPDEPSKPTLKGDADMNGFVELADLTTVSKYLLSPSAFPLKNAAAKANADMNGDGLINIVDLSELIENQLGK
jgi:predicted transport protein